MREKFPFPLFRFALLKAKIWFAGYFFSSEVSEGGDTVFQEGVDHPGGGMGVAARLSQRDTTAPEITTASGYALSAAPTLQTNQGSSFLGSR